VVHFIRKSQAMPSVSTITVTYYDSYLIVFWQEKNIPHNMTPVRPCCFLKCICAN